MLNWTEYFGQTLLFEEVIRLGVSILIAAMIGWDREKKDKPAGLRTHILVALGATIVMIATLEFSEMQNSGSNVLRVDPTRAIAGVIGGVGFLGAGCILQSRGSVQGVTTAASIWITAAIGICCGMGLLSLAVTSGLTALFVLIVLGLVERQFLGTKNASSDSDPASKLPRREDG